jgi:hypothetical protein
VRSRGEGEKKTTGILEELVEGCSQARGTGEEDQLYYDLFEGFRYDKPESLSATAAHAVTAHGRLIELGRGDHTDEDRRRSGDWKRTRQTTDISGLHVFAFPEHALGFYALADFAAGETTEVHTECKM